MKLPADPFIVAEISANHNGDLKRAFQLMEAAKDAGADAVKLQTYTADTMTIDHDGPGFVLKEGPWKGEKLYDLYKRAATPWIWHKALFGYGRRLGLTVFSTPCDKTAVDFLEELDCPIYKISSFEISDIPLIQHVVKTGKPLIISCGVASDDDYTAAMKAAPHAHFLHCVSDYPAKQVRLPLFDDAYVGLSDHTLSTLLPALAVARGATIIEKHLTLRRSDGGPDSSFSLEPAEFSDMVSKAQEAFKAVYGPAPPKSPYTHLRRSLYVTEDIGEGEELNMNNIRSIRPGHGLLPKHLAKMLGKKALRDLKRGEPLTLDAARSR